MKQPIKQASTATNSLSLEQQVSGSLLGGSNSAWLESVYESWQLAPESVPKKWRQYFEQLAVTDGVSVAESTEDEELHSQVRKHFLQVAKHSTSISSRHNHLQLQKQEKQTRVLQLINSYRFLGHLRAKTNPIFPESEIDVPELSMAYHQLDEADLKKTFATGSLVAPAELSLAEIIAQLKQTYCGSIGAEYMYIDDTRQKRWIQDRLEGVCSQPDFTDQQRRYILDRLTAAESLERFLHTRYVGQKRFSLEGGESLIPLLDALIQGAGSMGANELVIGMAHRGRLNVLVNILGKSPADLFSEFEGTKKHNNRTGDVKYHMGFASNMNTPGGLVHLALAFNPSHLEIVGPVVEGAVRARQELKQDTTGEQVIPVIIHGDAAVAGQGVVMETLNMSNIRAFSTHGTIRIIINNQIGFTTSVAKDSRSTMYCTDIAKMVNAPVFHVNADDPEAVVFVTRCALEFRNKFKKDVFIDLVCYRRHGHNEADEPATTQPVMYRRIRELPTTRALYAQNLVQQEVIAEAKAEEMVHTNRALLEKGEPVVPHLIKDSGEATAIFFDWSIYERRRWDTKAKTRIPEHKIKKLSGRMNKAPDSFSIHPRVAKIYQQRIKMGRGEQAMDWGFCELLAYAALLDDGFPIRLCGQDSRRGTFSHRHASLHNQNDTTVFTPLKHMYNNQPDFDVIDSFLSEEAVLAFEYGYSTTEPEKLVIWEAQFGDFANGAQVVIDQFISSGEQKWGRLTGLTMYLPHGFEGQGPEHSSARLERYLQLCAQKNMQVCVPSTPAQMFHLIRRQMIRKYRKPLIVFTPKSLLRHPLAVNNLRDISHGEFYPVMAEADEQAKNQITRIILCSGKVYYDLLVRRREGKKQKTVAILRIEQLYPFPKEQLKAMLEPYENLKELIWCQEEPVNQGAWDSIKHRFKALHRNLQVHAVTRPAAAAPAVGNIKTHKDQQRSLVEAALWQKEWN